MLLSSLLSGKEKSKSNIDKKDVPAGNKEDEPVGGKEEDKTAGDKVSWGCGLLFFVPVLHLDAHSPPVRGRICIWQ